MTFDYDSIITTNPNRRDIELAEAAVEEAAAQAERVLDRTSFDGIDYGYPDLVNGIPLVSFSLGLTVNGDDIEGEFVRRLLEQCGRAHGTGREIAFWEQGGKRFAADLIVREVSR